MDDVNVNELSDSAPVKAYKKFFGGKIYEWKHSSGDVFRVCFRVKDITFAYGGGYRIWCEILRLNYRGEKKIDTSKMNLLQSYFKRELSVDFSLFSINDVDIVILNRHTFEIGEPNKKVLFGGKYGFYEKSIKNYSYTSPKDELTSLTSYKLKFY